MYQSLGGYNNDIRICFAYYVLTTLGTGPMRKEEPLLCHTYRLIVRRASTISPLRR